jgi:hypothetical protein
MAQGLLFWDQVFGIVSTNFAAGFVCCVWLAWRESAWYYHTNHASPCIGLALSLAAPHLSFEHVWVVVRSKDKRVEILLVVVLSYFGRQ